MPVAKRSKPHTLCFWGGLMLHVIYFALSCIFLPAGLYCLSWLFIFPVTTLLGFWELRVRDVCGRKVGGSNLRCGWVEGSLITYINGAAQGPRRLALRWDLICTVCKAGPWGNIIPKHSLWLYIFQEECQARAAAILTSGITSSTHAGKPASSASALIPLQQS